MRGRCATTICPAGQFPGHCDIVVDTQVPGVIAVVGGNVDDAVTMKHVPVTPDGKLAGAGRDRAGHAVSVDGGAAAAGGGAGIVTVVSGRRWGGAAGYARCWRESGLCRVKGSKDHYGDTEKKEPAISLIFFAVSLCLCGDYLFLSIIEGTDFRSVSTTCLRRNKESRGYRPSPA